MRAKRKRTKYITAKRLRAEASKMVKQIPFAKRLCEIGTEKIPIAEWREFLIDSLARGIAVVYKDRGYRIPKRYRI